MMEQTFIPDASTNKFLQSTNKLGSLSSSCSRGHSNFSATLQATQQFSPLNTSKVTTKFNSPKNNVFSKTKLSTSMVGSQFSLLNKNITVQDSRSHLSSNSNLKLNDQKMSMTMIPAPRQQSMAEKTVKLAAYTQDLKQTQIRSMLNEVSQKRKSENAQQKNAYKKMLEFIKKRAEEERITPGQKEI